jgi:hypothetical protein
MSENLATYTVCFMGRPAGDWPAPRFVVDRLEGYDLHCRPTTTLTLRVSNQEQLMGVLNQLNTMGLPLLLVEDHSAPWARGDARTTIGADAGGTGTQQ